jgi:hypothetical protein
MVAGAAFVSFSGADRDEKKKCAESEEEKSDAHE